MLDVLAFFSPAFALARWILAHVPDLSAIFVPLSEEMTEAWDIVFPMAQRVLFCFLPLLLLFFAYLMFQFLLDPLA